MDGLGTSPQKVPEGMLQILILKKSTNATNTNFKKTNNTQSLGGANRAEIRTMDFLIARFFGWQKVTCIVQKQQC